MPWLPLAILLIVALTITSLALILYPPGEGGEQVAEDDITNGVGDASTDDELTADADGAMAGASLAPPPPDGDPVPPEKGDESLAESETLPGAIRPDEPSGA
jgi:hypothetical protein